MFSYFLRRLFWTGFVLLGVAVITFLLMHSIPGTPWQRLGPRAMQNVFISDATMRTLNQRYGLDLPLWRQFTRYMFGDVLSDGSFECGFICGHMGLSLRQLGRSVEEILFEPPENMGFWKSRFGYTLRLAGLAFLFTVALGLPLGIWSAIAGGYLSGVRSPFLGGQANRFSRWLERLVALLLAVGNSIPNFIVGLLLIVLLGSRLHLISIIPTWDRWQSWLTPALILALAPTAMLARLTRAALLEAMQGDYVRTARSKGLDETSILWRHILQNAAAPILTHLGPLLFELFAASFVIEIMFGFPGFGQEYYRAVTQMDYPMIMGLTLLYGIFVALANLLADMLCAVLDPRIREGLGR